MSNDHSTTTPATSPNRVREACDKRQVESPSTTRRRDWLRGACDEKHIEIELVSHFLDIESAVLEERLGATCSWILQLPHHWVHGAGCPPVLQAD